VDAGFRFLIKIIQTLPMDDHKLCLTSLEIFKSYDTSTQTLMNDIIDQKIGELLLSIFRFLQYPLFMTLIRDENRESIENYGMLNSFISEFDTELVLTYIG
jgi:hypothetical protein